MSDLRKIIIDDQEIDDKQSQRLNNSNHKAGVEVPRF
jgi:hypothetical protein